MACPTTPQAGTVASGAARMERGFTLIELMVVVIVLAIALAIGIPGFQGIINRNRIIGAANESVAAIQVARMEAIRRNQRVELCPSTNGTTCGGDDWSRLIVRVAGSGELVRDINLSVAGLVIQGSTNVATNNRISFSPNGFARVGNADESTGGLSLCSTKLPEAENTRDVIVAVSRVSVTTRNGTAACTPAPN
jgi:type IV fimbrial biogenesis protein FimT